MPVVGFFPGGGGDSSYIPQYDGQGKITLLSDDGSSGYAEFTTSGTLTWKGNRIPQNVDVFCVGGGAGGHYGKTVDGAEYAGGGGGGGYTTTSLNQTLAEKTVVTIGAGGAIGSQGGMTSIMSSSFHYAMGGFSGNMSGTAYGDFTGGDGGSGGGDGGRGYNNSVSSAIRGSAGGTDGGNGQKTTSGGQGKVGNGQGTTTKDLLGRIHAGGGAGGSGWYNEFATGSSAGGASDFESGKGENGANYSTIGQNASGSANSANSRGGGGGGGYGGGGGGGASNSGKAPGVGGQGFAMIAWGNYRSILGVE